MALCDRKATVYIVSRSKTPLMLLGLRNHTEESQTTHRDAVDDNLPIPTEHRLMYDVILR